MHLVSDGVPVMGLDVDRTRYFWYHHTAADTVDKLDRDEFNRCVAALCGHDVDRGRHAHTTSRMTSLFQR